MSKRETITLRLDPDDIESGQEILDALADMHNAEEEELSLELEIPREFASAIIYLRSRSYWAQKYEEELIRLGRAGEPLPGGIFSGEWAEEFDERDDVYNIEV